MRNKYSRPKRLWDMDRLEEEKELKKHYGLKNMREIWIAMAVLKKYRREARRLLSLTEEERKEDTEKILARLYRLGVLKKGASLDDILSLDVRSILERRLQSVVVQRGLAHTMAQSRQLITHGFIQVRDRRISAPSYLVYEEEEGHIRHAKAIELKAPPQAETKEETKTETKTETPAAEAAASAVENA